jgi:hypothetical protein
VSVGPVSEADSFDIYRPRPRIPFFFVVRTKLWEARSETRREAGDFANMAASRHQIVDLKGIILDDFSKFRDWMIQSLKWEGKSRLK